MSLYEKVDQEKLTPMMKQYCSIKNKAMDSILLYRIGDFYEMFFDDAVIASKVLGLALTGRDCGLDERAPMCGVPHHASLSYIKKLLDNSYKVSICEQLEEPGQGKQLVDRGIIKVFTPGTIIDDEYLSNDDNNFIVSLYCDDNCSISYSDISTGEMYVSHSFVYDSFKSVYDEIMRINPKEIIVNNDELFNKFRSYGFYTVKRNLSEDEDCVIEKINESTSLRFNKNLYDRHMLNSIFMIFEYFFENKNQFLKHIDNIYIYDISKFVELDESALKNLEIVKNLTDNTKRGSLLSVLDKTTTQKGARRLRSMLERPLKDIDEINYRLNVVEEFFKCPIVAETLKNILKSTFDIERICSKIAEKSANPADLINLRDTLRLIPNIKVQISKLDKIAFSRLSDLDEHKECLNLLNESLSDEPPQSINDGFVIKHGFNKELDSIRDDNSNIGDVLINYEDELKKTSDIKNLRIKYNKISGYYIEISKGQIDKVPDFFERTQTLKNVERFKTKKLREIEYNILNSSKIASELEKEIYNKILIYFIDFLSSLKELAFNLAEIDVYISLSTVARQNRYIRPSFNNNGVIELNNARHPVIESMNNLEEFIPNDVYLNNDKKIAIITGPNMSGKSTYMRMVALVQLMAQIGSFVPAEYANLAIVDKIFTRIGASDSLYSGKSTFMVEMSEVSYILNNATEKSLVILDEVGRGTSTFDGMAIAKAVIDYISKKIKSYTLFSTHYQELANVENYLSNVINLTLTIKEDGNDILFLRKVKPGITSKSYGIHVAKLAGLPNDVIVQAKKYQKEAEVDFRQIKQFDLLDDRYTKCDEKSDNSVFEDLKNYILNIDINNLTPVNALVEINNLIKKARD